MKFGIHLYELWRSRVGLVLSLVFAVAISLTTAYRVTLFPPGLRPKAMEMSAATTHVLVDSPNSVLLHLGVDADQLDEMSQRALLVGNLMGTSPVEQYIARRAGVPAPLIQVSPPLTPAYPRPIAGNPQTTRRTTDLVHSNNQYRINVKWNPTVPWLDIYTEASNVNTAEALANAAVDGTRDYLEAVAASQRVPADQQVRLDQLGLAVGGSVTSGVNVEVAVLVFLFVFALSSAATLVIARVVRGWRLSAEANKPGPGNNDNGTSGKAASGRDIERLLAR
jgi:hypothetical protein